MMASPASVDNAAGIIDSKAESKKASDKAPMSALPLKPPVSVPLNLLSMLVPVFLLLSASVLLRVPVPVPSSSHRLAPSAILIS